jgi:hypothetical protein
MVHPLDRIFVLHRGRGRDVRASRSLRSLATGGAFREVAGFFSLKKHDLMGFKHQEFGFSGI